MSHIIFLHGASSSGKSTLARALQARIDRPFWHISIDHLRDSGVLPMQRFCDGSFDWSERRAAVFEGFHLSLKSYADAGNDLILEHILDTEGWLERLSDLLRDHDVLFVGIQCPVDVLERREAARGDRPVGSARRDQETVHHGKIYDLEINGADELDVNVGKVLRAFRTAKSGAARRL
ncbi:AAA family ATPase [Martelella sp. HB161492]|uniref:chloramphenicol phosphotransferase CPT family protein n=1 Tax=Martelella sp. HB161492 TaxID=2720726 RepID=UPI00158FC535|nr:AAA family ATPase [Martelella sp. HB161492]